MTDSTPDPELDELVTAYLDGEATAAERARVQGDPALLARAEQLRAVSRMVAEPVDGPDAVLRDAHIAAALAASSTSPVVTAMPARRNRPDLLRFASVAAVVLAILVAVPLLLSNTGGDDADMAATEATSADDGLAAMESVATEGTDGAAEMAAEEAPADRSAGDEATGGEEEAPAEEGDATMEAPASDAETAMADEEPAEEETAGLDPADVDVALAGVPRVDVADVTSPQALRDELDSRLNSSADDGAEEDAEAPTSSGLGCGSAIADEIFQRGPAAAFGSTTVDGVASEFVAFPEPDAVVVIFDAATCEATFTG
jgi:hypothetical protein